MAQDTIDKIINIEFRYSDLIDGWNKASAAISEANEKLKEFKANDNSKGVAEQTQKIKALRSEMAQYTREIQANIKEEVKREGSVNQLRASIAKLTAEFNNLSRADREADVGRRKAKEIREMQTELNAANQSLLNFRDNVGNYASAAKGFTPLQFQVQQLAREIPSLTQSAQMFFLAISNNLPMFTDELKRAAAANKELKAEGKATISVFKQVLSSIISWQTAIVVAISLLIKYSDEIAAWVKGLFDANNELSNAAKYTQKFTQTVESSRAELKREFDALANAEKGTEEYAAARKVIEDRYGAFLANQKEEIRNLEDQKAAYDALAGSITAAAIARGLEESNADAAKEYGEAMDKAFKDVQEKFIKKFGREAGIAYFTEFRAGITSEIPELKARANEIYKMFDEVTGQRSIDEVDNDGFVRKYTFTYVDNPLEKAVTKAREATLQYNLALSDNNIAMQTLIKTYKISKDDIDSQSSATKDLLELKREEIEAAKAVVATTPEEVAARNKRVETLEKEYEVLANLGRTDKGEAKILERTNRIARKAAGTELGLEKELAQAVLELKQDGMNKEIEATRLRFEWEKTALENKLAYDKTLTAASREAINTLLLSAEERRLQEEAEIRKKWAEKEEEEEERNAKNRIKSREKIMEEMDALALAQVKNENYSMSISGNEDLVLQAQKNIADEELRIAERRLEELNELTEEEQEIRFGSIMAYETARLEAENRVQDAIRTTAEVAAQAEIKQLNTLSGLFGGIRGLLSALGGDLTAFAVIEKALAITQVIIDTQKGIVKAIAEAGINPFAQILAAKQIALLKATAAISIATIIAQAIPQFFSQGGLVTGPGTETSDSIPARLSNGEAVMTARAVNDWGAVLSAINVESGGRAISVSHLPERGDGMQGMRRMMEQVMAGMPAPVVAVKDINRGQKRVRVSENLGRMGSSRKSRKTFA